MDFILKLLYRLSLLAVLAITVYGWFAPRESFWTLVYLIGTQVPACLLTSFLHTRLHLRRRFRPTEPY